MSENPIINYKTSSGKMVQNAYDDEGNEYHRIVDELGNEGKWKSPDRDILSMEQEVTAQLAQKANKKASLIYFSDYGKPNDSTYDNTPDFLRAINDLQKTGGKLIIDAGLWEFKTPCVINKWLFGCSIEGMNRGLNNTQTDTNALTGFLGTNLNYSGTGALFTFNGKMTNCSISNFSVYLNGDTEFLKINYTFHRGIIKELYVNGGIGCIDMNTGTYPKINDVGYTTSNPNALYGIRIGFNSTRYLTEFFYIKNCSFDFASASSGIPIAVYRFEGGLYVETCDLCNTYGVGLLIQNDLGASENYFTIRDVNFTRCKTGIELYAKTGNIGGVFVDNVRYGLRTETVDELAVYCHSESGYNTMIHHKNAYIRTYTSNAPTYVANLSRMDNQSVFEINAGTTYESGFISPIAITSNIKRLYDYRSVYKGKMTIDFSTLTPTGTGTNYKDYKILISDLFSTHTDINSLPVVLPTFNCNFTNGFIKSELTGNKLYAYFRIGNDIPRPDVTMYFSVVV